MLVRVNPMAPPMHKTTNHPYSLVSVHFGQANALFLIKDKQQPVSIV